MEIYRGPARIKNNPTRYEFYLHHSRKRGLEGVMPPPPPQAFDISKDSNNIPNLNFQRDFFLELTSPPPGEKPAYKPVYIYIYIYTSLMNYRSFMIHPLFFFNGEVLEFLQALSLNLYPSVLLFTFDQ